MKKIAIIGAGDFQNQLILKAKEMKIETHVFAWEEGAVGKKNADYFYPVSIREKEEILEKCMEIGIDGICSIASDLAVITVNFVAQNMGLNSNSLRCSEIATNKFKMRKAFSVRGDPIPAFIEVSENEEIILTGMTFPLIVKPTDRSGSRGIFKVAEISQIQDAVKAAFQVSFEKKALIEEFVEGKEYSVECISFHGSHRLLAITEKFTTGAPHFIETGHNQPAEISDSLKLKIEKIVFHALDSLEITEGASHSEIKIDENEIIKIIEIGARMGGDCIGSDLVRISTGYDYTKMVIQVALNQEPEFVQVSKPAKGAVRFIFSKSDLKDMKEMLCKDYVLERKYLECQFDNHQITDSSRRYGYFIFRGEEI